MRTASLPFSVALVAAGLAAAVGAARAQDSCPLCDKQIVTNSALARCFLSQYDGYAGQAGSAIAIDLAACAPTSTSRGVIEALPGPGAAIAQAPSLQFMVSKDDLACLKKKLEAPGLVLDPTATIALDSCE